MEMDWGKDLHLGLGKRKRNAEGRSLGEEAIPDDSSCCPPLFSKHKIFLSHSGKQKWFVEKLCEDLEARHRFPFFDKLPSSLPKGERFPKLILEAAKQCKMAVVVVSEEFLMSKWPMIELSTFVQALSGTNPVLKILPLFFGMSVSDLGSPSRQAAWLEVWNKWESEDARIKSREFEEALKVMRSFNGIVFNGDMNHVWSFERNVVESICKEVGADVKWEDLHVQGRSSICEAARGKMKEMETYENGICVFGYYGVGGIGKTTMCKTLCNELLEFSGKACHVELGGTRSVEQMLKEVLKKLTNTSEEVLLSLDEGECRSVLKNRSSWRQRTFLAIDNVWDDDKSMEQAEMFMNEPTFFEGSVVMVTSRCRSTLMHVGIKESHCFEVPELGKEDARKLFVHHVANGKQFVNEEGKVVIEECIARCWFRKSETQGCHYLPLALKVLGVHLRRCGPSPTEWMEGLLGVRNFNRFEGDNPVFSIIRLNYDRLSLQLQALFMDVALFWQGWAWRKRHGDYGLSYFGELSLVHRQKLEDTQRQLEQLKERGLLEDLDIETEDVSMHDLYKEFAKMEASGKLDNSDNFHTRKWVYGEGSFPSDMERTPSGRCWENLNRVYFRFWSHDRAVVNLQGIHWMYFSNLVLLWLVFGDGGGGFLNLEGLRCLRSLRISWFDNIDGVDGLKNLNNLTYFHWNGLRKLEHSSVINSLGQLPASLKILFLDDVDVCVSSDMFDRCTNLSEVSLLSVRASGCIDLRQCTSLRCVHLLDVTGLEKLLFPPTKCLLSVRVSRCDTLGHVSGLGDLDCLRELALDGVPLLEAPNLHALKHLQGLSLSGCMRLSHLEGVEGLTSLRCLDTSRCKSLSRLPNLHNLTKLESLDLSGSGIELHEEDFAMLATLLTRLCCIRIRGTRLDGVSQLYWPDSHRGGLLSERDLELLPIQFF